VKFIKKYWFLLLLAVAGFFYFRKKSASASGQGNSNTVQDGTGFSSEPGSGAGGQPLADGTDYSSSGDGSGDPTKGSPPTPPVISVHVIPGLVKNNTPAPPKSVFPGLTGSGISGVPMGNGLAGHIGLVTPKVLAKG
jgi:hypothetical protein